MTFKKAWFKDKVSSSEGYSVEIESRTLLRYQDEQRCVYLSVERDFVSHCWEFLDDMWIDTPLGKPLQDAGVRGLVLKRVFAAFDFQGWKICRDCEERS